MMFSLIDFSMPITLPMASFDEDYARFSMMPAASDADLLRFFFGR